MSFQEALENVKKKGKGKPKPKGKGGKRPFPKGKGGKRPFPPKGKGFPSDEEEDGRPLPKRK